MRRDLDGALLTASQPVAVSSGGRGWSPGCGDDGMDGLVPVSALGREYAVRLPTGSAPQESRVRVIADVDDTVVRVNGAEVATLAAGAYYSFQPTAISYVQTSEPALVWMNGSLTGCELETALIPPIAFAPALTSLRLDFNVLMSNQSPPAGLAILLATRAVGPLRLHGVAPQLTSSTPVPTQPELSYVRFAVGTGDSNVRAASDFQAMLASRTAPSGLLAYYNPFRIPGCGDSGADPGEGCDDGDLDDGDGCSATCQIEPGYVCEQTPSACRTVCGDGLIGAPRDRATTATRWRRRLQRHLPPGADGRRACRRKRYHRCHTVVQRYRRSGCARAHRGGRPRGNDPRGRGGRLVLYAGRGAHRRHAHPRDHRDRRARRHVEAMRTLTIARATGLTLEAPRPDEVTRDATPPSRARRAGSSVEVRVDDVSVGSTMVRGSQLVSDARGATRPRPEAGRPTATDALANTISTTNGELHDR